MIVTPPTPDPTPPAGEPFDLWSSIRNTLILGRYVANDYANESYEKYSARLDALASQIADEFRPHLRAAGAADDGERVRRLEELAVAVGAYIDERNAWARGERWTDLAALELKLARAFAALSIPLPGARDE